MASRSLGTLTLDLVAKVGGFSQGLDKAGRDSDKWKRKVKKNAVDAGKAIGAFAAGSVTALAALTVHTADSAREIKNLSNLANTSTQSFQKMTFGAARYNIEQEKVADILKDTQDKIGDFIQTGGGPLADFFENIAPLVGVTAQEFKNLSGDQALQLYVSSLEKANLSQSDMTFYMEAIASDSAKLLPLLRDNGRELKALGDEAERTGNVFSDMDFEDLEELDQTILEFKDTLTGLKNQVVLEALPAVNDLMDTVTDPSVIEGIKSIAKALIDFTSAIVTAASETANFTKFVAEELAAFFGGPALDDIPRVEDHIKSLKKTIAQAEDPFAMWAPDSEEIAKLRKELSLYQNALDNFNETGNAFGLPGNRDSETDGGQSGNKTTPSVFGIDIDAKFIREGIDLHKEFEKQRDKANKKAQEEAKKLTQEIAEQVKGWEEQAKTVGYTADQLVIYRLEQMGATAEQIKAVEAAQHDLELYREKEKAAKDYKQLVSDLRTDQEKTTDELSAQLKIIKQAAGVSEEERNKQIGRAIDGAFGEEFDIGKTGDQEKIDKERSELEDWYAEQLEMLENFRKERSDLNEEWNEKEADINAEYAEKKRELEEESEELRRERIAEGYSAILDVVGKYYEGMEGKEAAYARAAIQIGKTLLDEKKRNQLEELWANTHSAAMGAYDAMASIPYIGPVLGAAAAGAVYVAGASAAAGLTGMAHDGLDPVPETGTWLLEKGEKVTTAKTSAKLDSTLDRVIEGFNESNRGGGGRTLTINQTIPMSGRPDKRTAQQMAQKTAQRMKMTEKRLG